MSEPRELSDAEVVKHFVRQGKCRSSIYKTIKNFKQCLSVDRKEGSGRKPIKTDSRTLEKVRRHMKANPDRGYRQLAKYMNVSDRKARSLIKEAGLKAFKQQNAPKSDENQEIHQKQKFLRLYRKFLCSGKDFVVVMDDESYFSLNGFRTHYYAKSRKAAPKMVKYHRLKKFQQQLWCELPLVSSVYRNPIFNLREGLSMLRYTPKNVLRSV